MLSDIRYCEAHNFQLVLAVAIESSFTARVDYPITTSTNSVSIADVTGDGVVDLTLAHRDGKNVEVYVGTGAGEFAMRKKLIANTVHVADLNGDGKTDLAMARASYSSFTQMQFLRVR